MPKIRGAMTGCAKMVCGSQSSPLLSRFTPPVAASLSKQPARGFKFPSLPTKFHRHWEVQKSLLASRVRTQSVSSLLSRSRSAESKELSTEAQQTRLILVDGKALVYRAYYRISGTSA